MNGSTPRILLKYGYSLCSKELLVHPSTSRFLFNYTTERNYCRPWSMQQNPRHTFSLPTVGFKYCSVNNSIVKFDHHRYFSTTPSQNGQTALKPKTPEPGAGNKQPKDKDKPVGDGKVESQPRIQTETEHAKEQVELDAQSEEKPTLTARFKKMYKDYWYVLLPVHIGTSALWLGGFYYLSSSGVDIPALLESMHFSEVVISKLRDSSMGHFAIAYLCYKIATPIRYTVTLGGTTITIKYLSQWGYIRPVPSKEKLKQMYDDQKAKFQKKD